MLGRRYLLARQWRQLDLDPTARFILFRRGLPRCLGVTSSRFASTETTATTDISPKRELQEASGVEDLLQGVVDVPSQAQAPPSGSNSTENMKTHQFDTFKFVSALQSSGFSQGQAVALMKCLRTVLVKGTEFGKTYYLSRGDLENVTFSEDYR
jgi:Coiled-coil domain-containing protein 90-like